MSKYFSTKTIMAAFSLLNKEKITKENFSALQYMFAFDSFVHEYHRDCDTGSDRDAFVFRAHKVGGLEDGESPDHIDCFTGEKPKKPKILIEFVRILLKELSCELSEHPAMTPNVTPKGKTTFFILPRRCSWSIQFAMSIWAPISNQRK